MHIPQEILEYKGWYYKVKINVPSDGILVGNFKYEKGWKAKIADKVVDTFPVNYLLNGVFVPAGEHIVEFFFKPDMMIYFYLTTFAILLTILIFVGGMILSKIWRIGGGGR